MLKIGPITTIARVNFDFALDDVRILLRFHDSTTGGGRGKPARDLEVLKRAGVILAVTAWETFVEDTLAREFRQKLAGAKGPKDIQSTFNSVASAWLQKMQLQNRQMQPPDLEKWTFDGWKSLITEKFSEDIAALNTPNSANVRAMFKKYTGGDITRAWRWKGVSSLDACNRLDALVRLRGSLVHRGKDLFDRKASAKRGNVVDAMDLLTRLVDRTENKLGVAPSS